MNVSNPLAIPRYVAPGGSMSTAEIKTRIEAMFADRPTLVPNESGGRKSA